MGDRRLCLTSKVVVTSLVRGVHHSTLLVSLNTPSLDNPGSEDFTVSSCLRHVYSASHG